MYALENMHIYTYFVCISIGRHFCKNLSFSLNISFICVCGGSVMPVCMPCMCASAGAWRSEDNIWRLLVLSFHLCGVVRTRNWSFGSDCKCIDLLSHLISPSLTFLVASKWLISKYFVFLKRDFCPPPSFNKHMTLAI